MFFFQIENEFVSVRQEVRQMMNRLHFGPRRPLPLVFAFLLAGVFFAASDLRLLLVGVDGSTLKKLSKRPCVDVVRVFRIFLHPPRIRSSLN